MEDAKGTLQPEVKLDRMLESALILSWQDLPHALEPGLVHIEYAPGTVLDYLKIWQLVAKGVWNLVCEYWMVLKPAGDQERLTFSNGYHSEGLARMLEEIMQHQENFTLSKGPGAGMIQVSEPSEESRHTACTFMQAYEHTRGTAAA